MSSLDERQIILLFQKILGNKKFVSEDVETIMVGGKLAVIKTDTLVHSTDVPPRMKMADISRKSLVACVSDFASKGVLPSHCLASISFPKTFSKKQIVQMARGFKAASDEFGLKVIGGDTNEAMELVISVMMFGVAQKITTRGGARVGDYIITSGPFGRTSAGLKIILEGKKSPREFAKVAKNAVYRAAPRLQFGVQASRYFSSAMDSSDGLSSTLNEMARQSKKKFTVTKMPHDPMLNRFARENSLDLLDLVLNGGEEYEIVATAPQKNLARLEQIAKRCKTSMYVIGRVQSGKGVFLEGGTRIKDAGWSHFAR